MIDHMREHMIKAIRRSAEQEPAPEKEGRIRRATEGRAGKACLRRLYYSIGLHVRKDREDRRQAIEKRKQNKEGRVQEGLNCPAFRLDLGTGWRS
jgi:hypothetical protein